MISKKTVFYVLVTSLLIVTAISYPVYLHLREWRASEMARDAEDMLKSPERMSRAWELAHAAKALNPDDVDVARSLARVYSISNPQAAYPFWEDVVELSPNSPKDQLELARAYLNAKDWKAFETEVSEQRNKGLHPQELDYLETLAAMLQGNYEDAFDRATKLVSKEDAPEEADTLFFQMTQRSSDPKVRRAGIDNLWKITTRGAPRDEEAIQTLASLAELQADDLQSLIDVIGQRENNSRDMELLAEELRLKLGTQDNESVYHRAKKLFKLDQPSEMASLGRWLNRQGLYQYTGQVIPLEVALSRQDLFLVYMDSIALQDDWDAVLQILDGQRLPIEDYLGAFFEARAFIEMKNERRARLAWEQALIATARDSTQLYYLALKARQLNLPDFEISALRRVIQSSIMRETALKELIAVLQRQGRTIELHKALLQYIEYFPGQKESENDALYLGFLIDQAPAGSLKKAKDLLESDPSILAYRMTLVLGLLKSNRPEDAIKLLDKLPVNWFEVRDRWTLWAAVALYRTNFKEDALKLSAHIKPTNLLPEERVFLEELTAVK